MDKITTEYVDSRIADVKFIDAGLTTVCLIEVDNGYTVEGVSHCADKAWYDRDIGRECALAKAKEAMFPLLVFALKELEHTCS